MGDKVSKGTLALIDKTAVEFKAHYGDQESLVESEIGQGMPVFDLVQSLLTKIPGMDQHAELQTQLLELLKSSQKGNLLVGLGAFLNSPIGMKSVSWVWEKAKGIKDMMVAKNAPLIDTIKETITNANSGEGTLPAVPQKSIFQ